MFFALPVGPKGLHFGGTFGSILGSILLPVGPPCFGAGQPAEIPILPSLKSWPWAGGLEDFLLPPAI